MTQLRDLTPPPQFREEAGPVFPYAPRPRPARKRRDWPQKLYGGLAIYGLFSLVIHAVVIYEVWSR